MDFENQNTASPWASRRKAIFLGAIVLVLAGVTFGIFWNYWYKAPSCFDNIKNGDESGIDCGGSCALICSQGTAKPIVRWDPRLFEVSPGLWSALVYVENPNANVEASYLPYAFTIYSDTNEVLAEKKGATILPPNKTVGIFEGGISVLEGKRPRRTIFEIGNNIVWKKSQKQEDDLVITHSPLLRLDSSPRIEATVKNTGIEELKNIELVVSIFDGSDNAVAASRTFIEKLKKNESTDVFFTWPRPFELGVKTCENPSDVVLLLDRSGSMASVSKEPPEPLTDAKAAAASFVDRLTAKDRVAVSSFASSSTEPIDLALTKNFTVAKEVINGVQIGQEGTQYTNIYEAIHSARTELLSNKLASPQPSQILVLLTDGVATSPKDPKGKGEADDIRYAESLAMREAQDAKAEGLTIYTIGLGKDINESFLKQIASAEDDYFFAPSADNLKTIYKNISSRICKEVPARIEITYRVFGDAI